MNVGPKIRAARLRKGLSGQALATQLGVTRSAVHQWEAEISRMSLEHTIEIARILEIPIVDLLPSGATTNEITVRDRDEIFLIEQFRRLSDKQREVYLKLLLVQAEDRPSS